MPQTVKACTRRARILIAMRKKLCHIACVAHAFLAAITGCLYAQESDPQQIPALTEDSQILAGTLENGFRYIIRPTKEPVGRGSVRLYVQVGSLNETAEQSGISHFLEHMVFNGSRTFKRGELIPTLQKLGLGFGGDANAYTSLNQTVYMLDLPNLQENTVDMALTIMRDFADGATLDDAAIDSERGIVVSELKSRDSASYRAMISLLGQLTAGTRAAQFMPIGREEVIRHAPYSTVRKYYHEQYVPSRMTLILTGDFKPQEAEQWVRKHFSGLEARRPAERPAMGELQVQQQRELIIPNPETADCTTIATVVRPFEDKPDTAARRLEDFPLELAIAMVNKRLRRIAQREDSPFNAASVESDDVFRVADTTSLSVSSSPEKWKSALEEAMLQLRQAITYGFSDQEVEEVTQDILSNLSHACDTWETVPAQTMATILVKALSNNLAFTDPAQNLSIARHAVQQLMDARRAGHDTAREALEKAFDAAQAKLSLIGVVPEDVSAPALRAAYEHTLQGVPAPPEQQKQLTFAYETIGMPGVIMHREDLTDLGITRLTLSNGVKINLKPIDFRKGSISVTAAVDGGAIALPPTPGLATMVSAVMRRGGLQEHSIDDIERITAGKQVGLTFSLGQTRFLFSGRTNAKNFELQCKLLAAAIMHPGFRSEGELLLRRSLDKEYKELTTKPEGAFAMQGRRAIFGENPRFVIPTQQQIEALSAHDVQQALAPMLKNNALEVSIVGDFDIETLLPAIERTFGAMPQRRAEFARISDLERHVEFRPWGQRLFLRYPTELDKTIVAQVRPAGNGRDMRRNRRLSLLSTIARSKLFDGLRAAMGESYSPQVSLHTNSDFDNAAYIVTISAGVKGNRSKVSAAMESICNALGQGQITQDDFDCAYRPFLARVQKMLISPDYWEENLEQLQSDPDRLALIRDLVDDAKSITLEEIRELAREIFGKADMTSFLFVVPEDYDVTDSETQQTSPAQPQADLSSLNTPAHGEYLALITEATSRLPEWKEVADALVAKYPGAQLCVLPELSERACTEALRKHQARYAAYVLRPEEISRSVVSDLHRAARGVDDDPYGDCLWGIVTGYDAASALSIATANDPLVIRRLLATTEISPARFEHSYCIADYEGFPVLEQHGYSTPTKTEYTSDTPEGQDVLENGLQEKFATQLAAHKPQLIITSSHATQFNLEMPFGKGLIFSAQNRFYLMRSKQMSAFASALQPAMNGKPGALLSLAEAMQFTPIAPESTPKVWIAAGNCLIGDAQQTNQSMVVTALSAYGCRQFVGYTVPSWYGEAGWGTLSLFMGNSDNTTLAEAFFLNNQFIIARTIKIDPKLLNIRFDEDRMGPALQRSVLDSGVSIPGSLAKTAIGLVHDRDTLAFYGDPGWPALVDHSHAHAPLAIHWENDSTCTLTAQTDYAGRAAIWFPSARIGRLHSGCDAPDAIYTNDFILLPHIDLKAGSRLTIKLTPRTADQAAN